MKQLVAYEVLQTYFKINKEQDLKRPTLINRTLSLSSYNILLNKQFIATKWLESWYLQYKEYVLKNSLLNIHWYIELFSIWVGSFLYLSWQFIPILCRFLRIWDLYILWNYWVVFESKTLIISGHDPACYIED